MIPKDQGEGVPRYQVVDGQVGAGDAAFPECWKLRTGSRCAEYPGVSKPAADL